MDSVTTPDFSELLDLPQHAFTGLDGDLIETSELLQSQCPAHPETANCLCNGTLGGWDLPEPSSDPYMGSLDEPDYAKFENWIPRFIRPEKPCDYCRVRRLNCYITRGETACTPCSALFRSCTLTDTHSLEAVNASTGHLLDTLHVVDEDVAKEQGTLTGIKPLRSKSRASGNVTPVGLDDAPGSSKRNGIRFPRHAVKTLKDWLDAHSDNPYPTDEERTELESKTELRPNQIANWLANARRRRKLTEKARPRACASPSLRPTTSAITIPAAEKPWDELNPFERWKHSPPEHEPAAITDIVNAVANSDLPDDQVSTSPSSFGRRQKRSSAGSGFSNARAPSATSFETGQSSSRSASNSIAYSHHSSQSHGSFGSFSSSLAGKKDRRRRRRPAHVPVRKHGDEKKRLFQCTFCTDTFKNKYDWTRHEKSLHLSLEKWICAPLGPVITDPATGNKRCVYCDELDPSKDHIETHNYQQCEEKGLDARTFYRKDHLRQHLRLMHNCEMTPFMENWKSVAVHINSRCGFCAQRFTVWQERVDHLTAHFKAGTRMAEWKGCRGLDPAVAAQVTNAMPPYLIGMESVSPVPFSASNKATWHHPEQEGTPPFGHECPDDPNASSRESQMADPGNDIRASCWEILTVRLGKYANEMAKNGIVLTDEMLQNQARCILYESDDAWNQTAADNPEWLDLFKKAHGLDFIPNQIGGQGTQVPDDLETYGDLGLRIPFAVQLQAYNQELAIGQAINDSAFPRSAEDSLHSDAMFQSMTSLQDLDNRSGRQASRELPGAESQVANKGLAKSVKKLYLQRHRYELPADRAQRFATTTGAWQDSGMMPDPTETMPPGIEQQDRTTTGAMMEFLGGNVGATLPFSTDVNTSTIPLQQGSGDWPVTTTAEQDAAMLDRLIAETTGSLAQPAITTDMYPIPVTEFDIPNDLVMGDFTLDDADFNFDSVFDMPMDETFV